MDTPTMLYILKLEKSKFYVGATQNLKSSINQHKNGNGAEWTKRYGFLDVVSVREMTSPLEEDLEVKKLMLQHGIGNVRGGSYSSIRLSANQLEVLDIELAHARCACLKCGKTTHYIKDCASTIFCFRCGRNVHHLGECFHTSMKRGEDDLLEEIRYCHVCGRDDHTTENDEDLSECLEFNRDGYKSRANSYCARCGRTDHNIITCYANTTCDGIKL
ncbi:Hypothetical protein POVR1_LOCUS352 [uncultured virus]|nr:Hypothetical protein POVR1_LOCUS352 [uncultured virus]